MKQEVVMIQEIGLRGIHRFCKERIRVEGGTGRKRGGRGEKV